MPCVHEEIYDRVVVWICERSGLPREIVERVLSYERQFWEEHPQLFERVLCLRPGLRNGFRNLRGGEHTPAFRAEFDLAALHIAGVSRDFIIRLGILIFQELVD